MSTIIDSIEKRQVRERPKFEAGDRVRVHFQVIEGSRTRTQIFEGVVIKRQGSGARETFTVRKQSFGVGVERTFPLHSPKIETLEVAGRGAVRRAKLYYLRDRIGKAARVAERRWGIEDELVLASDEAPAAVDAEGVTQDEAAGLTGEDAEAEAEGAGAEDEAADGDTEAADDSDPGAESDTNAEAEGDDADASADAGDGDADADSGESAEAGDADAATEGEAEAADPDGAKA